MKVERFFRDVVEQNEQALYAYFTPDAQILWHCTNECFTAQEFIRANCEYPGSWEGEIERLEQLDGRYILVGRVFARDRSCSHHVVSFIQMREDRLEPLREQSEKAGRFLELSKEKKTLEISLWARSMEQSRAQLEKQESEYLLAKNNCADIEAVLEEHQLRIQDGYEKVQELAVQIDRCQQQVSQMKNEQADCDAQIAVAQNDLHHNANAIEETHGQILTYTENKDDFKGRLKENQQELRIKQEELQKAQADESQARQEIVLIEEELAALNTEIAQMKGQRAAYEQDITRQKLNRVSSAALLEETSRRMQTLQDSQSERDDGISALQKELEECSQLLSDIEKRQEELGNAASGYQLKLQRQQRQQQQLEEECRSLRGQSDQLEHRARILTEMEKSLDGYYNSVKSVLSAGAQGRLKGIVGTVSQLISVSPQYAVAIETALGNAMQQVVTENETAAKNAINHLKYAKAGRATFLPLDVIQPQRLSADGIERMEGFVARADELVSCDERYRGIVANLLGRIAVSQDIDAAVEIARKFRYRFRIVTLDGQLVNAGGSMTGGSASKTTGLLSRKEEIHTLGQQIKGLQQKIEAHQPQLTQLQQTTAQLQAQLTAVQAQIKSCQEDKITYTAEHKRLQRSFDEACKTRDEMNHEYQQVKQKLEQLRYSSSDADALIEQVTESLEQLRTQLDESKEKQEHLEQAKAALGEQHNALRFEILGLQKDIESLTGTQNQLDGMIRQQDSQVQTLVDKVNTLQNAGRQLEKKIEQLQEKKQALSQGIEQQNTLIKQTMQQRSQAEQHLSQLRTEEKEQIARRERAAAQLSRCEERKVSLQTEYDKLIARLWDEYSMTRTDALEAAIEIEDEPRAQARLSELRTKIRSLGSVNVAAIEEYREVSERYRFLKEQSDDVENSRTELLSMIRELTAQMRQLFSESFEKINQYFQQIFTELFMGGQARLELTDPENILESGIEIHVQPPGKIIKNLSALSGGEKAFVAIAIYFAILKVKPSPFCILDEIEAALDEVNVSRYARYLKNLSDKTQFIAITHRRGTMEEADILYGVTMQEKGVSRLLELDITQLESRLGMKA